MEQLPSAEARAQRAQAPPQDALRAVCGVVGARRGAGKSVVG